MSDEIMPYGEAGADSERRYPILKLFRYAHLPEALQEHSKPFYDLAHKVAANGPHNAETSAALRKLREAKDCYVGAFAIQLSEVEG